MSAEKPPKATSVNAEGIFEPFDSAVVPWEDHNPNARFGMRYQHLASFGGATQIGLAIEILEPGKQSNPMHYHMLEEEHVLILEGEVTLKLGEKNYEMRTGHYVCFPAGQKVGHALYNHIGAPCRYVVLGSSNPHDVIVYPDSGRVSVRLTGEGYRKSETMTYWEGEKVD